MFASGVHSIDSSQHYHAMRRVDGEDLVEWQTPLKGRIGFLGLAVLPTRTQSAHNLAEHGLRRARQVRRVDLEFLASPPPYSLSMAIY